MSANEAYHTIGHDEAGRMIADQLGHLGWRAKREFVLPDGKTADVFVRTEDADFAIIEVKTEMKASLLDNAFEKYGRWSNMLWVAVPELRLHQLQGLDVKVDWTSRRDQVGILGVYREGIVAYRSPHQRSMLATRYDQLCAILNLS